MSIPHKIADILPQIFNQDHQWKYQLLSNWKNIFGAMSDKVYLERINNDILVLAVYDACWMQELYTLSPLLISSINKALDKPYIKQLRFKRAGIRPPKISRPTEPTPYIFRKSFLLTPREEKALSELKDPELAAAMKDFLMRCYCEQEMYKTSAVNKAKK